MHFKFNNGKFRICQLTDIHLEADRNPDLYDKTIELVKECVVNTNPDLVVITGDISWGRDTAGGLKRLIDTFKELKMPWAPILGNHDGNKNDCEIKSRKEFASHLIGQEFCLMSDDDKEVDGNGNYTISIGKDENNPHTVLFMLDSHEGEFFPSQLDWYRNKSKSIPQGHNELAFFHVPIPEFWEVWNFENCKGYNLENVCTTKYNDGLFSAMARGGAMRGIFVGHDHINDYEGTLRSIRLCYGRATGYQAYGLEGYLHGARIIDLDENEDGFSTKIYLTGGELYEQTTVHKPLLKRK